jgi:uncharacterized protein (TIGR03790 family)
VLGFPRKLKLRPELAPPESAAMHSPYPFMNLRKLALRWLLLLLALAGPHGRLLAADAPPFPRGYSLQPENLAVVINDEDARSVVVGGYYQKARNIPAQNMVHVRIPGSPRKLSAAEFDRLRQQVEAQLKPDIQAIVLAWTAPYAVECNSITAALTLGFDAEQCRNTCAPGKPSRYFNSNSLRPYSEFGMRIAMLLPADSVGVAESLIDRGKLAGFSIPPASAYFLVTSDADRSSRASYFPKSGRIPQRKLTIKTIKADSIEEVSDIMFYQTGLVRVPKLDTLRFLPGALADHLTSTGGDLLGTRQMSSLRWLEAGATASYGTVSEPCNYPQKFPNPSVLLRHYLAGASAIEAYWKSVAWPAQGLFIGEPLASPYRPYGGNKQRDQAIRR